MRCLIRNEIRLFFTQKNIICILLAIVGTFYLYMSQYMFNCENYAKEQKNHLSVFEVDIDIWKSEYEEVIEFIVTTLENDNLNAEEQALLETELEESTLLYEIWTEYESDQPLLSYYWKAWEENEKRILDIYKKWDELLWQVYEQELKVANSSIFYNTVDDWERRVLLRDAYEAAKIEEPLCFVTPTGAYVLADGLSGNSLFFLLLAILMILLNYDSWAADFERTTDKLIYTLPYKRTSIFVGRFFTRSVFSIFAISLVTIVLYVCGSIHFGSGWEQFQIVNQYGIHAMESLAEVGDNISSGNIVVNIENVVLWEVQIAVAYLLFLNAFVHFISFGCKNQMSVLIILATVGMLVIIGVLTMEVKAGMNPFLQFQGGQILQGMAGVTQKVAVAELLIGFGILTIGTIIWMKYGEIK